MNRRSDPLPFHGLWPAAVAATLAVGLLTASAHAAAAATPRLSAFSSCGQLGAYARRQATEVLEARSRQPVPPPAPSIGGDPMSREQAATAPDHSSTNVQEAGVDEPDAIKLDATRMFSAVGGRLRALDLTGPAPRLLDQLDLPGEGHELLLHGDRLVAIATAGEYGEATRLTEVDVRDPGALRVVRTIDVPGWAVSSRRNGAIARVVISTPAPYFDAPAKVRRARWRPRARFRHRPSGRSATRALVACRRVRRPARFAGLGMLSVLTFDLDRGLFPVDSDAIMTDGDTVYGSPDALYVATERWLEPGVDPDELPSDTTTLVHRLTGGERPVTTYAGSAAVPGYLIGQFALSEHAGYLRVATTADPPWSEDAREGRSESLVTVLAARERRLVRVGRVSGLGRGERIYAVRFMGDVGFVVTFRETDPLYALDLRDPRAPRVAGELKIPGYSAYLHPVGDGLLLGVGQDATARGELRGSQVSLFDVSDLRRPVRVAQRGFGARSGSPVEEDHRAFMFWEPTGLAVLPLTVDAPDWNDERPLFAGAVGLRVGPGRTLNEVGRFEQVRGVTRSAMHGGRLYTVSEGGLRVADSQTLRQQAWLPFHPPPE